jgi:hypothetical protein
MLSFRNLFFFLVWLWMLLTLSTVAGSVKKWSLTFLLECNNPHYQRQHSLRKSLRHDKKNLPTPTLTQLSSTAPLKTYDDSLSASTQDSSATTTPKRKQWNQPISSVFEPSSISHQANIESSSRTTTPSSYDDADYQQRKQEWVTRYTTLNGLRDAFGGNRNKVWGDLDPVTTRKLYKSLLPTALCELVLDLGVRPEELAPLAYAARKAAKLYARERSCVPARIAATAYDGFRQLKRYGKFQPAGMSYDQVWDKYRRLTYLETSNSSTSAQSNRLSSLPNSGWSEEEIVARTCMKIIESSCRTNPQIDQFAVRGGQTTSSTRLGRADMKKIAQTLEYTDVFAGPKVNWKYRLGDQSQSYACKPDLFPVIINYVRATPSHRPTNIRLLVSEDTYAFCSKTVRRPFPHNATTFRLGNYAVLCFCRTLFRFMCFVKIEHHGLCILSWTSWTSSIQNTISPHDTKAVLATSQFQASRY